MKRTKNFKIPKPIDYNAIERQLLELMRADRKLRSILRNLMAKDHIFSTKGAAFWFMFGVCVKYNMRYDNEALGKLWRAEIDGSFINPAERAVLQEYSPYIKKMGLRGFLIQAYLL